MDRIIEINLVYTYGHNDDGHVIGCLQVPIDERENDVFGSIFPHSICEGIFEYKTYISNNLSHHYITGNHYAFRYIFNKSIYSVSDHDRYATSGMARFIYLRYGFESADGDHYEYRFFIDSKNSIKSPEAEMTNLLPDRIRRRRANADIIVPEDIISACEIAAETHDYGNSYMSYMSKGTCKVAAPMNAVAQIYGGMYSRIIFIDRHGRPICAYKEGGIYGYEVVETDIPHNIDWNKVTHIGKGRVDALMGVAR